MAQVRGITAQLDLCIVESDDAQCNACTLPIGIGSIAILNPAKNALCCWTCAGAQLKAAVAGPANPLIIT